MIPSLPKSISYPQIRPERILNTERSTVSADATISISPVPETENVQHASGMEMDKNGKGQRHVHFSDTLSPAVCRICHGGETSCPFTNGGSLISPCHCSGSMGLYHRRCLEIWLSTSNRDKCEICKFQYMVKRRPKSWIEFLSNPGSRSIHRNMMADTICLILLTPMAMASCWLCIAGASAVAENNTNDAMAIPGLISLAIFLIVIYFVWLSVSLRYHCQVWKQWRGQNQTIHLVTPPRSNRRTNSDIMDANNNSPRETVYLQPLTEIPQRRSGDIISNSNASHDESPVGNSATSNYVNAAFVWETMV